MDPIVQTAIDFIEALLENPLVGPALMGAVRSATGYLQLKYKGATGMTFNRGELGATLIKYEVAINALSAVLPMDFKYVSALTLVADIIGSFSRKLIKK